MRYVYFGGKELFGYDISVWVEKDKQRKFYRVSEIGAPAWLRPMELKATTYRRAAEAYLSYRNIRMKEERNNEDEDVRD